MQVISKLRSVHVANASFAQRPVEAVHYHHQRAQDVA